jgi:hypothetical protein
MSKKLIAVASAAALALSALVAAPASAASFAVAVEGEVSGGNGISAAAPALINIPTQDALRFLAANSISISVARLDVTTTVADASVTVTTTGGVKVLNKADWDNADVLKNARAGSTSATGSASSTTANFYVYTTSTAVGTAVVTQGGNSVTVFIQGDKPAPYKLKSVSAPKFVSSGVAANFDYVVEDAFGNLVPTNAVPTTTIAGPATISTASAWDDDDKVYRTKVTGSSTETGAVLLTATISPAAVAAFGPTVSFVFTSINATDLSTAVATLEAQLAASRPKANSVTKKRYNTLVRAHRALGGTAKLKK